MRLVLLGSLVTLAAAAQAGPAQPSARASVFEDEAPPEQEPLPEGEALKELPRDGGEEFNRLVFETSPYLRQHARNPVNWYPWGTEAFRTAAVNKKPVLLSVGYSTCHWCHVMEHESFEDPQIAALLNETFICVKVDREERPDIDAVYMQVTQAMTGRGGWPNTILMTPEGKPFFAGTYLPPRGRYGREGLAELTTRTAQAWREQRDQLGTTADEIARILNERTLERDPGDLSEQILEQGAASLAQAYDEGRGGFGSAPKFPVPHRLGFLLRAYQRDGDEAKLAMVLRQLDAMRAGGIWDHVGHGFHRYSTDANWFLPHFEKMLYDQALLTTAYVEAYQVTGEPRYRQTASEILDYISDRLTAPEGAFYSAEDADSEGEEGIFYIWTPEELKEVLGEEDAQLAIDWFGVEADGNYIDEGSGKKTGSSVLHTPHGLDAFAAARDLAGQADAAAAPSAMVGETLEGIRKRLYEAREQRERPFRDDKILTDWNGLAIAAHAQAGRVFGAELGASYVRKARRAAAFVRSNLRQEDGRLYKLWRAGEASGAGMLDDYAFLAHGLVELYTATFDESYLAWSLELCDLMLELFWDEANGGLFLAPSDGESLMLRPKQVYDGATPSGNSVAAMTFVRLARLTGRTELEDRARAIFHAFGGEVNGNPAAHSQLLMALDYLQGPTYELVVAAPGDDHAWDVLEPLQRAFLPRVALLSRPAGEEPAIAALAAFTKEQRAVQEKATLYLCQDFTCEAPTTDVQGVLKRLQGAADEEQ